MAVNEPRRDGTRIGETVGSWRWTGREWVSSGNGYANSNSGLPFIGNLGDMSDVKTDGDGNLIIDFPDDLFAGIDFGPKHYPIQLYWNSSPAVNMKVAHNGDTKTSWNSADFLGGKTFTGKAGGYGESENSFTVTTTENAGVYGFPLYEVKITDSTGGSSILSGAHTGTFKFKKEEVIVIDPPTDYTLEIICDFSSGYVANVSGTSINNSKSITKKFNGPFNVTSTTKPVGTKTSFRLLDSSNKVLGTTDSGVFTGPTLAFGQTYRLYLTASKTTIPIVVIPPTPPTPTPPDGPSFNMVPYTVTETSTSGEAAPAYTLPILTIFPENQYVTLFTGVESTSSITVPFTTRNADWVNKRTKSVFKRSESTNSITLSSQDFPQGPGQYKVWLQPDSNINGTGEAKWIYVTVENKEYVPGPDITTINYPETIVGADYQGFNVDFEISWNSINTNYVDVFIGKVSDSTKLISNGDPQGVQKFNIAKILRKAGEALEESQDWVWFDLYLCPYNSEGDEITKGKTESVKIAFDKGNIILKRPSVIRDISDAICHQFNSDALGQDNSKYLTHLMHFGNGNNKVIATWCTDYEEFSKYEDVIEEVANDEGEYVEQIITKKTHEEKTLVFKMYEPLPRSVQPNEQIWVSKIQSIPIIEQITLINEELHDCIELKPNFGEGICDPIGYQLYDDLVSSGSVSSTKLLSEFVSGSGFDLSNLNIEFTSAERDVVDSVYVDGVSTWGWGNFVKYSSATERVNNFLYKIKLVEFHDDRVVNLQSGSFYTGSVRIKKEIDDNIESAQKIKDNFDAFEKFLFTSSSADGLTYPGAGGSSISASTSTEAVDWYSDIILSAQYYDKYSTEYLVNNLPQHVRDNAEGEEFEMFFNMMGHHFDVIWLYTKSLAESKNLEHKYNNGIQDGLLSQMLKSLGWDAKMGVSAQALWQYAFGTTEDGTVVNSMSGKDRQEEVWRRLLNNLPYLMKHKGTSRAVKAALACYGVPSSMLTIMEFGGPRNGDGGASQVTFEDRTAAINISGSQSILVPWKQYDDTSDYPNTVEFRVNSDIRQDQTFVTSSLWSVGVVHYFGNQAKLKLTVADTTSSYFVTSSEFPFYNDEYTNIVVEKSGSVFTVKGKEAFQGRIRSDVSASLNVENNIWQTDTILKIGDGSTFTGSVDEFRYWTVPLSESRVDNHTLMPDAIDGNHVSSSTEDLILRLDFEYPKDRNANVYIKNVSINEGYDEDFVTASNFNSITEYPYHYTTYDRDVTANVPSSGFNVGNKFRFETQQALASDEYIEKGITLSYRERATKKSLDTSPIDSNKLGMFFSPVKEINMDILKSLGQFEIDQYIGEPDDRYRNEYFELRKLRNYYFERYTINLYEYIQLVRYIDQSLFETLESLVPARAIVSSGLLIEPHILERSKYEHKKPQAVDVAGKFADGKITLREGKQLLFEDVNPLPFNLNPTKGWKLRGDRSNYSGLFKNHRPRFRGNYNQYNTRIGGLLPVFLPSLDLIDGRITDTQFVQKLMKQFEVLGGQEQVGINPRNLTNGLAGIYARNGIANITRLDGNGTLIKERKQVWIVTERFTVKEPQRNDIGLYVDVDVVKTRKIVVFNEIGDPAPSGVNILSAEAVNSNGGNVRGSSNLGKKYANDNDRGFRNETKQTSKTTLDGKSAVETFCTNPNILKVADSKRGAGEPILQVEG
tara:strand:+ start:878 stop:5932 length:5055 start_codon:yes stop_codon:yes gene_type:complete